VVVMETEICSNSISVIWMPVH
jgi:hypothetical protein